jgi:prophage regulatory protein
MPSNTIAPTPGGQPPSGVTPQPERLIRLDEVIHITGLRKTSIYAAMNAGEFPKSIKITSRASAWSLSAVNRWVSSRVESGEAGK